MRTLGILGGMSWESTVEYYRLLNRGVGARVGGLSSAPLLIHSVDFAGIATLMEAGAWEELGKRLARAACGLEQAGAEGLILATNTLHTVAPAIERVIGIPLLHIVDPVGEAFRKAGIGRAGLLGTRYTMELPFWRSRMAERFGVRLDVPPPEDRALVNRVIFDELVKGVVRPESKAAYIGVIERLAAAGASAAVLGCTEISLLLKPGEMALPLYDTTALHVEAALEFILGTG